ncbi:MAG: desulfoferrodoxin Dfx [Bacilli bacterium]|nr:desulfoferrodoxin Dfx [Bacilli bacterium]
MSTFYYCKLCHNLLAFKEEQTETPICCGQPMVKLNPNTTDGALEKHVPVVKVEGDKVCVQVGSVPHPMSVPHLIEYIILETDKGFKIQSLTASDKPEAEFDLGGEKPIAAYEMCNLHGFWKAEI